MDILLTLIDLQEGDPTFPLVDVPDQDLDEEQKKEKRKQRMMKGAHLARQKLKEEKQAEKDKLVRGLQNQVERSS
jgi:actin-related protein 5